MATLVSVFRSTSKKGEFSMAKLIEFTELAHSAPVHINADNVKVVRDNPASPGSSTVEMMDGKIIYVTGKHMDVAKKLSS